MSNKLTIKGARNNLNMRQIDLANAIGVSKDTIGKWERGMSFPNIKIIPKLEKALNIEYKDIIFLTNNDA